ncbi:MAG: SMR family transporter, partial [Exiguobacterium chiriqhucha]
MSWVFLIGAGLAEMMAVFWMGKSKGYQIVKWSILSVGTFALSFYLLSRSLETLPLG